MKLHDWEPTDTEGHAYQCTECGEEVAAGGDQLGECEGAKKIYASVSFSGCSCGCTPGGSLNVSGDRESVIKRLSDYYSEYSVDGSAPYHKLWLSQGDELEGEVKMLADKLNVIKKKIDVWEEKIRKNGHLKWEVERAARTLNIEVPEEKLKQIENVPADDEVCNKEIKKLRKELFELTVGQDLDVDDEKEDEDDFL